MAYSLISHRTSVSTDGNGFTSGTLDTTGADLIIVHVSEGTGTFAGSLTDNKGNTYIPLTTHVGGATDRCSKLFYSQAPTVGTGHTWSISGSSNFPGLNIAAFSGSASTPFDVENGNGVTFQTTIQTGNVTPSVDNELVIVGLQFDNGDTPTNDQSLTAIELINDQGFGHQSSQLSYIIETTATSKNPTYTITNSSRMAVSIATFKSAAAGGTVALEWRQPISQPTNHFRPDIVSV